MDRHRTHPNLTTSHPCTWGWQAWTTPVSLASSGWLGSSKTSACSSTTSSCMRLAHLFEVVGRVCEVPGMSIANCKKSDKSVSQHKKKKKLTQKNKTIGIVRPWLAKWIWVVRLKIAKRNRFVRLPTDEQRTFVWPYSVEQYYFVQLTITEQI